MPDQSTNNAYQYCHNMARSHYENFPVASWLLPAKLREPVSAIYAFARIADDIADEGNEDVPTRLRQLDEHAAKLENAINDPSDSEPVFIAVADSITRYNLDKQLLHDLLTAFRLDITKKRYASFDEVLDYCHFSANPVGRLLLQVFDKDNVENREYSDSVCTALQLINFYQDIEQDYLENNRIYIALDDMHAVNVTEDHIRHKISDHSMQELVHEQCFRAGMMLLDGLPLCRILGGRMGLEIRFTILAAHMVNLKLLRQDNVFARPRLRKSDWLRIFMQVLLGRTPDIEAMPPIS